MGILVSVTFVNLQWDGVVGKWYYLDRSAGSDLDNAETDSVEAESSSRSEMPRRSERLAQKRKRENARKANSTL